MIASYQNNIPNPFILDASLVNRCYFNLYNNGDVSLDGLVNISDIVFLVNYLTGVIELNNIQQNLADTNQDGQINVIDIVQLINIIIGELWKNIFIYLLL